MTIVDDGAQIAESGLKPPFESPHLDSSHFFSLPEPFFAGLLREKVRHPTMEPLLVSKNYRDFEASSLGFSTKNLP